MYRTTVIAGWRRSRKCKADNSTARFRLKERPSILQSMIPPPVASCRNAIRRRPRSWCGPKAIAVVRGRLPKRDLVKPTKLERFLC